MTSWLADSRIFIIPPLLSLFVGLTLAGLSLFRSRRHTENLLFAIVCIWWSLLAPVFISHHLTSDTGLLLRIERSVHFFYAFNPAINILFFHHMLALDRRRLASAAFILSAIFALCTPFPFYFSGLYQFSWGYIAHGGVAFQLFGGYCIASAGYCAMLLYRRIRAEKHTVQGRKYRYMLFSFGFASLLTALNMPAISGLDVYPPGNFVFIPLAILAYGVLRYQLMDIRSIFHVTLFWLIVSSLVLLPNILVFHLLQPHLAAIAPWSLFVLLSAWFGGNYVYLKFAQPLIDRLFNRKYHDLRRIELQFLENIAFLKNIDELVREFSKVLKEALALKHADILVQSIPSSHYRSPGNAPCILAPELVKWFKDHHQLVDRRLIESAPEFIVIRQAIQSCLDPTSTRYLMPLCQDGNLIAILRLSEKANLRPLSRNEIRFIGRVAAASSIAFSNSLLFQDISNLKENLERQADSLAREIGERQEVEKQLRKSDEKYRTVLESIEDGYYEVSLEGHLQFYNDALSRILGYNMAEMDGMSYRRFVNPSNRRRIIHTFRKVLQSGQPAKAVDWELICKDGRQRPIQASVTLIRDVEGQPIGYRGIARDISDLKQAEAERHRLETRLQNASKMEAIGMLAGKVAHDLNNILSGLVGYPELLLMDLTEDDPLRPSLLAIKESGEKASAIVQDLLTLARRGVTVTKVTDLNHVIELFLQSPEHQNIFRQHPDVDVVAHLDPDLLNIAGSPFHLSKALMNLLSNAAEAMPTGGTITIRTRSVYVDRPLRGYDTVEEGDYAALEVQDAGIGIAESDLGQIFEPFYTKKAMGKSGTGLGMSVVWGTVKDHRGYVEVQSIEGRGTTFTLYFPVTREAADLPESRPDLDDYLGRGETILVVDDIREQRDIASGMLGKLGYTVATVASGEDAIAWLDAQGADLLILDMIMEPGIDGLETYRRIADQHPGQKAIIASGYSETRRVREAQRLGAGTYIKKPYTLEKIGMAVRAELDTQASSRNSEVAP
jgi:two-component system, cell cycle sensor histidine kinase and response regulator CckA